MVVRMVPPAMVRSMDVRARVVSLANGMPVGVAA